MSYSEHQGVFAVDWTVISMPLALGLRASDLKAGSGRTMGSIHCTGALHIALMLVRDTLT